MADLNKKEALRKVLKDVQNAHGLIFEYQKRVLNLIKHIKGCVNCSSVNIHKFPVEDGDKDLRELQYSAFTEIFIGSKEKNDKENVFSIIVSTGRNENEKSELIFILDTKSYFLKKELKEKEYYFANIISGNEDIHKELKEKGCEIRRRNIEDFYNEEALKKEWKIICKSIPVCWLNKDRT